LEGVYRNYFKLYALAIKLDLKAGATKEAIMQGIVLEESELVAIFEIK
jgi:phosphatidylethanolamine-binding protein (PEBP) family uncharacterized protein